MKRKLIIAPSLLSCDFCNIAAEVKRVENSGGDRLHLDVMDGHFVPNLTFGPPIIANLKKYTKLPYDAHLMVENPDTLIPDFAKAGVSSITVHPEGQPHLHRTLSTIKSLGIMAGVALNPSTPLSAIKWVLDDVGMILIMSVNPGFGGQSFIPISLEKIRHIRSMIGERNIILAVDGGIDANTAGAVVKSGANYLVSGSYLFNGDMKEKIGILKKIGDDQF